jgi:general secretion pathway protein E/type IV pilus assembly protein PilB
MNIAETRAPQDGRISIKFSGRQIDFRASAQPTTTAKTSCCACWTARKASCRWTAWAWPRRNSPAEADDRPARRRDPRDRPDRQRQDHHAVLDPQPHQTESVNIMTLEDPVEYPMNMIRQTSVNESAKLGFANGIRSMMRQDPDVILVGEIRDEETAEMAFAAAMTGHQVYSTLHTNSAIGAIPRLLDIGVLPDIMAGNIIGIVAQRLVRKLCPHCREAHGRRHRAPPARPGRGPARKRCTARSAATLRAPGLQGPHRHHGTAENDAALDELIARRASTRELKTRRRRRLPQPDRRRPAPRAGRRDHAGRSGPRGRPDRRLA